MNIVGTTATIAKIAPSLGYIARMHIRLLALSLMLLAAACGGTDAAPATTSAPSATTGTTGAEKTEAPDSTQNPGTTATTSTEGRSAEGPAAPGFVTTLSDGSQFDMAAHDQPVYLVFWAEW